MVKLRQSKAKPCQINLFTLAGKEQRAHSCGLHAAQDGLGYDDLNELQRDMKPLDFEFELIKVEEPNTYEKELWQMNPEEMMANVPKLVERFSFKRP